MSSVVEQAPPGEIYDRNDVVTTGWLLEWNMRNCKVKQPPRKGYSVGGVNLQFLLENFNLLVLFCCRRTLAFSHQPTINAVPPLSPNR